MSGSQTGSKGGRILSHPGSGLVSSCRTSCHPSITHRRERAPDDRLGGRDDMEAGTARNTVRRWRGKPQKGSAASQQDQSQFHWVTPLNWLGNSSTSPRSTVSIFLALVVLAKAKLSAATSLPVFQFRNCTLYCGPRSTCFDVMM
jgi:hypothetical protein